MESRLTASPGSSEPIGGAYAEPNVIDVNKHRRTSEEDPQSDCTSAVRLERAMLEFTLNKQQFRFIVFAFRRRPEDFPRSLFVMHPGNDNNSLAADEEGAKRVFSLE